MKHTHPTDPGGPEKQPEPRRPFDLDHMDLHADVSVNRFEDEEKSKQAPAKKPKRSRTRELLFSAFLNMILAAGFGYLMWERQETATLHQKEQSAFQHRIEGLNAQIQEALKQIESLSGNNKELKHKGESLSDRQKALASSIAKEREQKRKFKKEIASLKKVKTKLEKDVKTQKNKVKSLNRKLAKVEKTNKAKIAALEEASTKRDQEHLAQIALIEGKLSKSQAGQTLLKREIDRYKAQITEEAQAGKAAMVQQGKLAAENRRLLERLKKLELERKNYMAEIKDLKEVTTGELIPFSTDITLPVPHYKEPFPKGLKWPRGTDLILVHMKINESGSVSEIYYPRGQFIDTTFKSIMSPVLFKWKFSPPRYQTLNVKAWIPVVIRKP
jgi:hypothetical protein